MRYDMARLVRDARGYEDRFGKEPKRARKHRNQPDERPNREGNGPRRGGVGGVRFSVLRRWLRKQVGRPWNDVHSEAKGAIDDRQIFDYIIGMVTRSEIKMIDGWPHYLPTHRWGRGADPWYDLRHGELYVDGDGMLRMTPEGGQSPSEKRWRDRCEGPRIIKLDALTVAARVEGVWFKAELVEVPTHEAWLPLYGTTGTYAVRREDAFEDALCKKIGTFKGNLVSTRPSSYERACLYGSGDLYAKSIRTMSKKEIKQRIPEDKR